MYLHCTQTFRLHQVSERIPGKHLCKRRSRCNFPYLLQLPLCSSSSSIELYHLPFTGFNDITTYLPNLALNKNANEDAFNLIQNTSYALNDTQFTLYARIDDFDYEKSEGDFDITIDYGMIETKYDSLPNREDFLI